MSDFDITMKKYFLGNSTASASTSYTLDNYNQKMSEIAQNPQLKDELKKKGQLFITIELIAVDTKLLVNGRRVDNKVEVYGVKKVELQQKGKLLTVPELIH